MKAARDYLERKHLENMRQATKKSFSRKKDAAPAPTRPSSAGKPQGIGICYTISRQGNAPEARIAGINHEKSGKGKGGGKKGKPRSSSIKALVVRCLQGLGTKFASFGRLVNVTVVVNVHSSICPSLQLRLPKTTSVGRGRTRVIVVAMPVAGGRRCPSVASARQWPVPVAGLPVAGRQKMFIIWRKKKKDDLGSNSAKGSRSLKDKGGTPSSSGSTAVCLMRALMMVAVISHSTSTHRVPEGFASTPFH